MKNIYTFVLMVCFMPLLSFASPGVSGEFGLTFPKGTIKIDNRSDKTYFGFGGRIGVNFDFKAADNFYLVAGVSYVTNGLRTMSQGYLLHTVQLPLDIVFKIDTQQNKGVFIGLGSYFAFNANAGDYHNEIKKTDLGFDANVGYRFDKLVMLRVRCQLGLSNIFNDTYSYGTVSGNTFSLGFSVCYTFEKREVRKVVSDTPQ